MQKFTVFDKNGHYGNDLCNTFTDLPSQWLSLGEKISQGLRNIMVWVTESTWLMVRESRLWLK